MNAQLSEPYPERKEILTVHRDPGRLSCDFGEIDGALEIEDPLDRADDDVEGTLEILADHVSAEMLDLDVELSQHLADPDEFTVVDHQDFGT